MASEKHKSKGDKKQKSSSSSHGEKKRKREHKEDGHKSKSKKHKSSKSTPHSTTLEQSSDSSPFHIQTSSLFLPLAPISQQYPLEGLCAEHLSPLLLTYYPPFEGVLLSYHNARISEKPFAVISTSSTSTTTLLQNIDEYAVSWAWVTAEFLLFKPEKGAWLEGYVNLVNEGHIGVVCWNLFNASIERKRLPEDWKWVGVEIMEGEGYSEGAGYFIDGEGKKVDGMIKFQVKAIEKSHDRERGFLSIEGTMLDAEAEETLVESENRKPRERGGRAGGAKALGATNLGVPVESDLMDKDTSKRGKHRHKY
ncbi:hypothetical protein G7Y89_g11887 [Cudoniella acicularis]|uniref:DNA-directed RNA polymerase subunit n=1 Tax=Cudoniella acicularis TaxID=354080 RepID=A0A8H4RCG4_9HELO|nr:hypothetical protein G7Y89_g11887 [Cudoniella acicularis]